MKKKKTILVLRVIIWTMTVFFLLGTCYLARHKNARRLNDLLEKPISKLDLSTEQKLNDFEYFYDCLVSSVPGETMKAYEARYGISFAQRHDLYVEAIKATKSDLEYFCLMRAIGEEIPSFHTGIAYPSYDYYNTLGCWNIDDLLDVRGIKSKSQYWNDLLYKNAKRLAEEKSMSHLFWYEEGQYRTDAGEVLVAVDGQSTDALYEKLGHAKILYDDIYKRTYRNSIIFYAEPYSEGLSEKVVIKYYNAEGVLEEREVYRDIVAELLTGYAQALGVGTKTQYYVNENPFYSYLDEKRGILYLYFTGIGRFELQEAASVLQNTEYQSVIIDIRSNSGGVFTTVNECLYPYLYREDIEEDYVWYMPENEYTDKMTGEWKAKKQLAFKPSEYRAISAAGGEQQYKESVKSVRLTGGATAKNADVYVLISNGTGSAADTLASVLKENDAATLIGCNTGGEGLMSSFLVDYLPESGVVFTYTPERSVNRDGTDNSAYGTSPHYYVEGTYPKWEVYESGKEDPYTYENRLEWDAVLNKAIELIEGKC